MFHMCLNTTLSYSHVKMCFIITLRFKRVQHVSHYYIKVSTYLANVSVLHKGTKTFNMCLNITLSYTSTMMPFIRLSDNFDLTSVERRMPYFKQVIYV